ncbi:hypothetical protein L914_12434, partial [Phytophthora nicotianae]
MPKSIHFGLDLTLGQEVIKLDPNIKVGMRILQLQTNLLSRSFAIHTNFQDYFSQLVGKYTCRKIATEDE